MQYVEHLAKQNNAMEAFYNAITQKGGMIMMLNKKNSGVEKGRFGAKKYARNTCDALYAELTDISNITGEKKWVLDKKIVKIGRDPENDIIITQATISSLHASIKYEKNDFFLKDCGSRNKTRLNGKTLKPNSYRKLNNGDEIALNSYKFRFSLTDPPGSINKTSTIINFASNSVTYNSSLSSGSEMPRAILIDIKNVTGKKTLNLHRQTINIGRGVHNNLVIPQKTVSGSHATIQYKENIFYLEDQRSTNKTQLNGKKIGPYSPVKLKSGDEILFDKYKFVFLLEYQIPFGDTDRK